MFCTRCGKQLHDGDAFCAHCGTKVREDLLFKSEIKTTPKFSKYDDVVFNPPFKAEAERRTQTIEESTNPYSSEPKKERISFDWNLDGFPTAERKKDDSFEINWDAVIEKKRETKGITVEKIVPEIQEEPEKEEIVVEKIELKEEVSKKEVADEPLSIEDLERALFGTGDFDALDDNAPGVTIEYTTVKEGKKKEEFYTYNMQRDAFQELLDKERARLEALEEERKSQWEEIAAIDQDIEYVPKKALEFEDVFKEPSLPLTPPVKEVAVVLPPLTARVMVEDEEEVQYEVVLPPLTARVEALEETEDVAPVEEIEEEVSSPFLEEESLPEETKEKTKLRYSDVFPADAFDSISDDKSDKLAKEEIDDDDDDEEDGKGNGWIKVLIAILTLVVLIEVVIIGVKFVAPDSQLAIMVDGVMDKVTSLFSQEDEEDPPEINIDENLVETYISELSGNNQNIGSVKHGDALKYDLSKTYAFDEIGQTNEFQDVDWNGEGNKTNGYYIVEAIISYYDTWKANNPESSVVGVNEVTIGEIRTGSSGYYVLNKIIYAEEGGTLEKYETVYLEASQDKIIVKEVKEETIS